MCLKIDNANAVVNVQACGAEEHCPFMNNTNTEVSCAGRQGGHAMKSFPGGPCQNDTNCISGACENQICTGKGIGESCKSETECLPGYSCKKMGILKHAPNNQKKETHARLI